MSSSGDRESSILSAGIPRLARPPNPCKFVPLAGMRAAGGDSYLPIQWELRALGGQFWGGGGLVGAACAARPTLNERVRCNKDNIYRSSPTTHLPIRRLICYAPAH